MAIVDNDHAVRVRAYDIWERQGRPSGREHEHWAEAARQVEAETEAPGLLSNFVQRTDNAFNGVKDDRLIGRDLSEEEQRADELTDDDRDVEVDVTKRAVSAAPRNAA